MAHRISEQCGHNNSNERFTISAILKEKTPLDRKDKAVEEDLSSTFGVPGSA